MINPQKFSEENTEHDPIDSLVLTILNVLKEGIVITGTDLVYPGPRVLFANDALLKNTGYSREELLEGSPRIFQGDLTNRRLLATLRETLEAGQVFNCETVNYRKNGQPYNVDLTISPLYDEKGVLCAYMGVQRDITEIKQAEQATLAAESMRQQVQVEMKEVQIKEQLVSEISRELRAPMTSIHTAAEILQRYSDRLSPDRRDVHLRVILSEVRFMNDILNDVIAISSTSGSILRCNPEPTDVVQFAWDLMRQIEMQNEARNLTFIFSAPQPIKNVRVDQRLLRYVLFNLLSNAAKYTPADGVVELTVRKDNEGLVLTISDTGIGIPEENLQDLFRPFSRGLNAPVKAGTGLGLVIVKSAVDALRGEIQIDSQVDLGTTITVRLHSCICDECTHNDVQVLGGE